MGLYKNVSYACGYVAGWENRYKEQKIGLGRKSRRKSEKRKGDKLTWKTETAFERNGLISSRDNFPPFKTLHVTSRSDTLESFSMTFFFTTSLRWSGSFCSPPSIKFLRKELILSQSEQQNQSPTGNSCNKKHIIRFCPKKINSRILQHPICLQSSTISIEEKRQYVPLSPASYASSYSLHDILFHTVRNTSIKH